VRGGHPNVGIIEADAMRRAREATAIINGDWMVGDDEFGSRPGSVSYLPDALCPDSAIHILNSLKQKKPHIAIPSFR
jgi:hypothetical protein